MSLYEGNLLSSAEIQIVGDTFAYDEDGNDAVTFEFDVADSKPFVIESMSFSLLIQEQGGNNAGILVPRDHFRTLLIRESTSGLANPNTLPVISGVVGGGATTVTQGKLIYDERAMNPFPFGDERITKLIVLFLWYALGDINNISWVPGTDIKMFPLMSISYFTNPKMK